MARRYTLVRTGFTGGHFDGYHGYEPTHDDAEYRKGYAQGQAARAERSRLMDAVVAKFKRITAAGTFPARFMGVQDGDGT